jgi:hypothetical protein
MDPLSTVISALGLSLNLLRIREVKWAGLALIGQQPLTGTLRPTASRSPDQQVWAITELEAVPPTVDPRRDLERLQARAWLVVPTTVHVTAVNRLHADNTAIRITEIILRPIERRPLPDLREYALLIDTATQAGGRTPEAGFSVWLRAGLEAPVPLLARLRLDGGEFESEPHVRRGDQYEIALSLHPDQPGLYTYALEVRCSDGRAHWTQPFSGAIRVAHLTPADYEHFGRYVRTHVGMATFQSASRSWPCGELRPLPESAPPSAITCLSASSTLCRYKNAIGPMRKSWSPPQAKALSISLRAASL